MSLKKLNSDAHYEVFMGIEVPHVTHVDHPGSILTNHTIGQFYQHINNCIHDLGDMIFLKVGLNGK